MVQPNDDDCISTGKEREDRQVQTKSRFEPLQLDVKCLDTAILLLGSRERPVLIAAASALTKFAAKGKENLQKLFELDIVDSLAPLIEHDDLFTRRFAARLLGEMSAIPFVRNYLLESEFHLPRIAKIISEDTDIFMQEYASLIFAEISKDPCGAVKLLEMCSSLNFLFENLKIPDPDVKKNNIEIMNNLLKDYTGADRIIESQTFGFPLICQLLDESYPEIQSLALSVLESLVARNKDNRIQELFRESGVLRLLLELLDNVDFADLHPDILRLLTRAVENPLTLESLVSSGGASKLFRYFEASSNLRELRAVLEVLVLLANSTSGRETLHDLEILKHLLRVLRGSSREPEMLRIACHGIGMMSRYEPASKEIVQENPIKAILDVLKDENLKLATREAAIFALSELCTSDRQNCQNFLDVKGREYLQLMLRQMMGKLPPEVGVVAVNILSFMGGYPDFRELLVEAELVEALCSSFEEKDRSFDELKIASCRAMSNFCVDKRTREIFLAKDLVQKLFNLLLDTELTPVRAAAVQLVQQLAGDPVIAEKFVETGYLNYMLKNRAVSTVVPSWNTCIDSLFSAHLPVKFAATGRISMHEITGDGFYVMRRHVCPFPILDELFRLKVCPLDPIYVVNFADPRSSVVDDRSRSSSVSKGRSIDSAWLEIKFGKLQKDPKLFDYLETFRCILAANDPSKTMMEDRQGIVNISKIELRAKLLARFVARQMSGPDPRNPCIDHQLEIHVREIREGLGTNVIPLGQLRVGSYLERALLFKVMADQICLPVSLVRGEYGKAWNEIAVPEIDNPVEDLNASRLPSILYPFPKKYLSITRLDEKSCGPGSDGQLNETDKIPEPSDDLKTVLPTSLLRKNYIVDLMDTPGDLIPIKSSRATAYCASVLRCPMTCDV